MISKHEFLSFKHYFCRETPSNTRHNSTRHNSNDRTWDFRTRPTLSPVVAVAVAVAVVVVAVAVVVVVVAVVFSTSP